jgi:hypothetical protein
VGPLTVADQVNLLSTLRPAFYQLGEPGAPANGASTCTDNVGREIVRRERGQIITSRQFRQAARPGDTTPRAGLTPAQFLRGLRSFGVRGYGYHAHPRLADLLEASERGIVLAVVGYNGYPTQAEAELGGKTDIAFRGPHATSLWGSRRWAKPPASWDPGRPFRPGLRVWMRDPDHDHADPLGWDRFAAALLIRAMNAVVGNGGWTNTAAIWKE